MICPECGETIEKHYKFCSACGKNINYTRTCNACLNPVKITQNYCVNCGSPLTDNEDKTQSNKSWKLFPVSIILYSTILIVHFVFYIISAKNAVENMYIISIFDSVMIIIWASLPVYNLKETIKFNFKIKFKHILFYIGGIIAGFLFSVAVIKLIQFFLGTKSVSLVNTLENAGYSFTAVILMICVQPAIIEEVAFRGIIFKALNKTLKPAETILISAFLFAMLHLSFISLPHLMVLGIFYGYLRYKTGSIWPPVAAHFLHNFAAIMLDKYNVF